MENKINRMVLYYHGIMNKKKLGIINDFDLNNPEHICMLFTHLDGFNNQPIAKAQFYIDNINIIEQKYSETINEYNIYCKNFIPNMIIKDFYGDGIHKYESKLDFYDFIRNKFNIKLA
jgi:hypothetical protein